MWCMLAHSAHRLPSGGCTMQIAACLAVADSFRLRPEKRGVQAHPEAAAPVQFVNVSGVADHVGPCTTIRLPDGNEARIPLP